jgi:two-component sensor histidine kinase
MFLEKSFSKLTRLGVTEQMPLIISDRIKIINKFCLLCIAYTIPYILFSIYWNFYSSAFIFFGAQMLFIFALYCNRVERFLTAKTIVIIATNFSVFYLSLFYGYSSGFHLYYFTSPLIVLSLFSFDEMRKFVMGISLYLVSILTLVVINHSKYEAFVEIPADVLGILYTINVFLVLSFCILIAVNFANFNKKINAVMFDKNIVLEENQELLKNEIFERKVTESKLQESVHEIEILLSETHHRVKNNLAVVSGMLDLQMISTDDDDIKEVLTDSRNRIKSMSLIHESLYQYDKLSQIEFSRYLNTLTEEIKKTYATISNSITLNRNFETIYLPVNKAIPCGLLVNEVLANVYKHAFLERLEGKIDMSFAKEGDFLTLKIKDNGVGFDVKDLETNASLGMTLIEAFAKQLKADFHYLNDCGSTFIIKFKP